MSKMGGSDFPDPRVEELMSKLRMLEQEKRQLEMEVKNAESVRDNLQKELENLETEVNKQEGIQKDKEGTLRKLQLQCKESEQALDRQMNQNKTSEESLERYKCEIQEVKLKHRKQRMRFENQLLQLTEQHKQLDFVFNPKRLPDELKKAEERKRQLLSVEQVKLAQLHELDEELEEVKKQQQSETGASKIDE